MSFFKTLLIGTWAIVGGCTITVGGCTVGATKASLKAVDSMASNVSTSHFNKLYADSPAQAETKYTEVTTKCYDDTMRVMLGPNLPKAVITERVDFDLYELRIKHTGDQQSIQSLPALRQQSEAKILASVPDKTQRRRVKKYLKQIKKRAVLETVCIADGLAPEKDSNSQRHASLRR